MLVLVSAVETAVPGQPVHRGTSTERGDYKARDGGDGSQVLL
ncbi:hypothetical protein RZS08_38790 [Arthrospira platensis SPKY1]|nr:hypothetical protein [Arthrospira platensis SPKY1]